MKKEKKKKILTYLKIRIKYICIENKKKHSLYIDSKENLLIGMSKECNSIP